MNASDVKRDDMGLVHIGMAALAAGGLWLLWSEYHADISYYGLKWAWFQLGLIDWPCMPDAVKTGRHQAATLAATPAAVTADQLLALLNLAARAFVCLPIGLAARAFRIAQKHPANRTRRHITVDTLPWIMSSHSPAVIPSLYYGDLLNTDPPDHRSSMNPEEWVAEHSLLVNGVFDRDRCRALLSLDLGKAIESLEELAPHEKCLFAVFGARLFSDNIDKAQRLLDALNRSCHGHTWQGKRGYPDLSLTDTDFAVCALHPDASGWLARHPYPRTLLHSMHKAALKTGKLPSAHFLWLKGMDRGLWYALNTTGRKGPFIESAAVFTQALWEDFAADKGYRLPSPQLDDAIDGIEAYLVKIGLMSAQTPREK
ncbi:intracellular multiplication protein IcmP [Oxalobacteraceae bacterium GrIS 1.11]